MSISIRYMCSLKCCHQLVVCVRWWIKLLYLTLSDLPRVRDKPLPCRPGDFRMTYASKLDCRRLLLCQWLSRTYVCTRIAGDAFVANQRDAGHPNLNTSGTPGDGMLSEGTAQHDPVSVTQKAKQLFALLCKAGNRNRRRRRGDGCGCACVVLVF